MFEASVRAVPSVGMITLRGEMETLTRAVDAVTGCAPPEVRMFTRSSEVTAMWMSPDELLLVCDGNGAQDLETRLGAELASDFATLAIVSDARQMFDISGEGAVELLSKLMPVDFAKLGATEVRRTRMAQIPAALWRHQTGFYLVCFRSVAEYAKDLLENARPLGG